MEKFLLSKNQTDWLLFRRLGLSSELVHHKLEYSSELRSVCNFKKKTWSFQFDDERNAIISLAYRFDGQYIATTHSDHSVRIIETETGNVVSTLFGHLRTPWTVKWHPTDPNLLASGCLGGMIILWDAKREKILKQTLLSTNQPIDSLNFHPSQDLLIVTCYDSVYLWEYTKQIQPKCIIKQPGRAVIACNFAGGGELLLVGSKAVKDDSFEEIGRIDEYLLYQDNNEYHVSKPIEITSSGLFLSDRGFAISQCGLFLLMVLGIPQPNELPHYCILGYGPVIDRDILMLTEEQNKKDFSHFQSFSRIMQHSINADSEAEVVVDSSYQEKYHSQYGFDRSAKCDIGSGKVRCRLAVLSLDPATKGYILEFINIREQVEIISVDFCQSNNFILLCTENKNPIYRNGKSETIATIRVIQSSTWEVVFQQDFISDTPNTAVWNPIDSSFACGLCNGDLVIFK